jgi:LmbE family N-acetylglucosaminyl deacetylase
LIRGKKLLNKNILVVVAHPDDETLGMGGTIRKHVNAGDNVFVISMTDGVSSRNDSLSEGISERSKAANLASEYLGFVWDESYSFADNAMDQYPLLELVKCIEKTKNKIKPNLVYTHSAADLNIDHRVLAEAVLTAFRPSPNEICKEIRLFEVPSATDFGHENITGRFVPNLFIGIEETWPLKLSALQAYGSEMRDYPHSRSLEGVKNLVELRGNQVGLTMAEAFQVVRKIKS